MKCLLFISVLSGGGAERVMCQLANELAARQDEVMLVASYKTAKEYDVSKTIKKVYLNKKTVIGQVRELRNLIYSENPDVCISFLPEPNFKLLVSAVGLKARTIVSVRNDPRHEYSRITYKFLAKILYNWSDGIVFQTQEAKQWFSYSIQKKSKVIMNQVSRVFFCTPKEKSEYYLATGRLTAQKNYTLMIKAFAEFLKKYPNETLRIYGEGELRERIQTIIEELEVENNVFLMGHTEEMPQVLSKAKAFLLTSNYEGMPNGLMEAMAMGIPCVSTDCPCGGPRMIINNGVNGILTDVGDENQLYHSLLKLQKDDILSCGLGKEAAKAALRFAPETIINEWVDYINQIIKD